MYSDTDVLDYVPLSLGHIAAMWMSRTALELLICCTMLDRYWPIYDIKSKKHYLLPHQRRINCHIEQDGIVR